MYCAGADGVKCKLIGTALPLILVAAGFAASGKAASALAPWAPSFGPAQDASADRRCPPLNTVPGQNATAASASLACRFDPTLTRLFTPRVGPENTYRVFVTNAALEAVLAAFVARAGGQSSTATDGAPRPAEGPARAAGSWTVESMDPLDAFGESGIYDRPKVGRLYVGVRAHVARGPIVESGRTVASITLISPYPDPSLTRLERGTMIIEFRIAGSR